MDNCTAEIPSTGIADCDCPCNCAGASPCDACADHWMGRVMSPHFICALLAGHDGECEFVSLDAATVWAVTP